MAEMWNLFDEHWFLAFLALVGFISLSHALLFRLPNRVLRTIKVMKRGWPPQHLDADGDFKTKPDS